MVVSIAGHSEGFLAVRFPGDRAWLIPNGRVEGDRPLNALYYTDIFSLPDSRDAKPASFFDEPPQALGRALAALLFLFRQVLETPVGELGEVIRAKKPVRLPRPQGPHR